MMRAGMKALHFPFRNNEKSHADGYTAGGWLNMRSADPAARNLDSEAAIVLHIGNGRTRW